MEEKIFDLLSTLSAFNKLDNKIIEIISHIFNIDVKQICKVNGITYFIER